MIKGLNEAIRKLGVFTKSEITQVEQGLRKQQIRRNGLLLDSGQICQAFNFIETGSFRHFTRMDGEERTLNLWLENQWALDYQSFTAQKVTKNLIVAMEESVVHELPIHQLHHLIELSPAFFQLGKIMEFAMPDKELVNNKLSPEDKYALLLKKSPEVVHRFPLKYIASYLGMTPETLSRVRKKLAG